MLLSEAYLVDLSVQLEISYTLTHFLAVYYQNEKLLLEFSENSGQKKTTSAYGAVGGRSVNRHYIWYPDAVS